MIPGRRKEQGDVSGNRIYNKYNMAELQVSRGLISSEVNLFFPELLQIRGLGKIDEIIVWKSNKPVPAFSGAFSFISSTIR